MELISTPVVFIPALLADDAMYREVIARLGKAVDAQVMVSPKSRLADSVADVLAQAPATFALVGASYGGNLALEIALAAPERVSALWLMGCNPAAAQPGGFDLASALETSLDAVIDMLAGLVVNKAATNKAAAFKAMAQRIGGTAGAAQARAVATRREVISRLGCLQMPALVLWGNDDALAPVPIGRELADALPHSQFHVFADCGHLPTLEKPAESAGLFAEFLRNQARHRADPP